MTSNHEKADVYLSLGSNIGNRIEHLKMGLSLLKETGEIISVSSIVETPAWGYDDPNAYLNLAAHLQMNSSPNELHLKIKKIEAAAGRRMHNTSNVGYEARTLDIDILFFDDLIINTEELQIPHPRMQLRNFVLNPLSEIAPRFVHPLLKLSVTEMLKNCPDKSAITRFADGV